MDIYQPVHKRAREDSWREKCIKRWRLDPVPDAWKDQIGIGSEVAWKKYYEVRNEKDVEDTEDINCENMDGGDELKAEWRDGVHYLVEKYIGPKLRWHFSPHLENCTLLANELETVTFCAYVWSPYRIPRALYLVHDYHYRADRIPGVEFDEDDEVDTTGPPLKFQCCWCYEIVNFEYKYREIVRSEMKEMCSCSFGDDELQDYVIIVDGLNKGTIDFLRSFLFGSSSQASEKETCGDYQFMLILYASMGVFDYETLWWTKEIGHGWTWGPWDIKDNKGVLQLFADAGLVNLDDDGEYRDSTFSISWLEYYTRKAANALRPFDKYYRDPTIEDARSYRLPASDQDDGEEQEELQ